MTARTHKPVDMAARRKLKERAVIEPPAAAEPQPEQEQPPAMVVAVLKLVFTVDGKPAIGLNLPMQFPRPDEDQAAQLELKLDGRELLKRLEPALGPTQASAVQPQRVALWTPGQQ